MNWGGKEFNNKPRMSFFAYLVAFFSEGFGWLILGLASICGLLYLFGGKIK